MHGVQTVQVHFGAVTFSAGRGDVILAQYTHKLWGDVTVFLVGRIARVQGGGLHAGDTWSIQINYHPSHMDHNTVLVRVGNDKRTTFMAPFGGGLVPYISIK